MKDLEKIANKIRCDIVKMVAKAGSGHPGGSLSSVEILTMLYFEKMNVDPKNPQMPNRDRLVMSKGHATPVLYSVLAAKGYFPEEELDHFRQLGSILQGHPDMRKVPGVEMSTGSLGQGISTAVGMAISGKLDQSDHKIYAILGDGELQEGLVWEAAMSAAHYQLDNLIAFVDNNDLQIDGDIRDVMSPYPIVDKFKAFGWHVISVEDGNSLDLLKEAWAEAKDVKGQPTVIVCKTVKGKGVSYMENVCGWHGVAPKPEELEIALKELELED